MDSKRRSKGHGRTTRQLTTEASVDAYARRWPEDNQVRVEAGYEDGQRRAYVRKRTGSRYYDSRGKTPGEICLSVAQNLEGDDPTAVALRRAMWQDYGPWEDNPCPWEVVFCGDDRNRVIDLEPGLTAEEKTILKLYIDGYSSDDIGERLPISGRTVRRKLRIIGQKYAEKGLSFLEANTQILSCWRDQTRYRDDGKHLRDCCGDSALNKSNAAAKPCAKAVEVPGPGGTPLRVCYCEKECAEEEPDKRGLQELPDWRDWQYWKKAG